jgi:hypothetical protein
MVAMKYRCQCITLEGRRCKKAFSFVCNKAKCCFIHAKAYLNYVLTIQKAYKGYHCRKYVRLLARLPCDIQGRILFYMREPLYNARKNKCIQKILYKKFITFFGIPENIGANFASVFLGVWRTSIFTMIKGQFNEHVLLIAHLYKLYTKYLTISNVKCNYGLYIISDVVKKDIQECSYYYHYAGEPYLYTDEELAALHKSEQELEKSISAYKLEYKDC